MKKALKILTMILVVCMFSTFMISCAKAPEFKDAKKSLEKEDYYVITNKSENFDMYFELYVDVMKEAGLKVKGYESIILAASEDEEDLMVAVLYKEKSVAKETFKAVEEKFPKLLTDMKKELKDYPAGSMEYETINAQYKAFKTMVYERVGNWVVVGHEDAIATFKGE